jgi:serine protease
VETSSGTARGVAALIWSVNPAWTNVDVYRNGRKVTTTANDGYHADWIWFPTGTTYTYRVCQASSTVCSPTITVTAQTLP